MGGRHLTAAYAAFLRGINVGGARVLPMIDLRALVATLGCTDVKSYIASGNLVFRSDRSDRGAGAIGAAISAAIEDRYGYDVPVMIRSAADMAAAERAAPFSETDGARYVGFCEAPPGPLELPPHMAPDRAQVIDREVFFAYPNGRSDTKLTPAWVEAALGTPVTVRNWRTFAKMCAMVAEL